MMIKKSKLSTEDYILFLKESASNSGNINKILFFLGGVFSIAMIGKCLITESVKTADVVLFVIGVLLMNLPKIIFYNEVRRTLKSEYLSDLTQEFEIKFSKNTFTISSNEQEYETSYSDTQGIYVTEHFFVIILNEIRHFPLLKKSFNEEEIEQLASYFEIG